MAAMMTLETIGSKLASRRFIITVLTLFATTILRVNGLIEAENFETIVIWLTGIYIIGKPIGDSFTLLINKQTK